MKIMASSPNTSWKIDGKNVEIVSDFIFLSFKITVDGDWSQKIKRCLLLGRKAMTNLDSILKSRDITLPTMVLIIKAMVFPVVIYGYESWTIKKAECQRIDAFELWCWRRLLSVPWTARGSNQSVLKEINWIFTGRTGAEAEAPILWLPDVKSQLTGKDPDAEKEWRQEEKRATKDAMVGSHPQWTWVCVNSGNSEGQGSLCASIHGVSKSHTWLRDWTTTTILGQHSSISGS